MSIAVTSPLAEDVYNPKTRAEFIAAHPECASFTDQCTVCAGASRSMHLPSAVTVSRRNTTARWAGSIIPRRCLQ